MKLMGTCQDHLINKAFFRWLYVVILRLSDERVPPEITKITQQDLSFIAEFLLHFDGLVTEQEEAAGRGPAAATGGGARKLRFNLEMLGQYLLDADLKMQVKTDGNPWEAFVGENPDLAAQSCAVPDFRRASLVQQHAHLSRAVRDVFSRPNTSIGKLFTLAKVTDCVDVPGPGGLKLTHANAAAGGGLLFAFVDSRPAAPGFYFLEVPLEPASPTKCAYYHFDPAARRADGEGKKPEGVKSTLRVLDVQFYLPEVLSVLLLEHVGETRTTIFVQFPAALLTGNSAAVDLSLAPRVEACALLDVGALKPVDNMVASKFAVSGSRKVAVVLSESRRKVRLFEMEAEEEEEEDEGMETTLSTNKDSDLSALDASKDSDLNDD